MDKTRISIDEFHAKARDGLTPEAAGDYVVPRACPAQVRMTDEDEANAVSTWVASTADVDRYDDTINVSGWELDNFRNGGSILFGHNQSALPVGRPLSTWTERGALKIRMEHDLSTDFNRAVWDMVKGGFLRSNSVGFIAKEWKFADGEGRSGIDFLRQELIENSIVPVPANPSAMVSAVGKSMDLAPVMAWHERALDEGGAALLGLPEQVVAESLKAMRGNPVSVPAPLTADDFRDAVKSAADQVFNSAARA